MNIENLRQAMANCKTDKQVRKAIKDAGLKVVRDTTEDLGTFSVWVSDTVRIYKRRKNEYVVQQWGKIDATYSGIPTFFGTDSYF